MKQVLCSVFVWMLATVCAGAQTYPALHDVAVSAGSSLNVRAQPTVASSRVGSLAHGQTGIEVTAADPTGNWGRINHEGMAAWASLAYLQAQPAPTVPPGDRLTCAGTEPFWALEIVQGQSAVLKRPGEADLPLAAATAQPASNRFEPFLVDLGASHAAILHRETCSDGMSDQLFGLSALLLDLAAGGKTLFTGCCSVTP